MSSTKTIMVSRRARALSALLRLAEQEAIILRSGDGHGFILAEVDDFGREIELTRKNKRLMKLLDERAKQHASITLAEAEARLNP